MQSVASGIKKVFQRKDQTNFLLSSCLPENLETLDLFDNQLDQVGDHLRGPSLVRADIGANNISTEEIKSLGARYSLFIFYLFVVFH